MKYWKTVYIACLLPLYTLYAGDLPTFSSDSPLARDYPFIPRIFVMDKHQDKDHGQKVHILNGLTHYSSLSIQGEKFAFDFGNGGIAFNPEFSHLYILSSKAHRITIVILDPDSPHPGPSAQAKIFTLPQQITDPRGIALSPTNTELYVASQADTEAPKIFVFDILQNSSSEPLILKKTFGQNITLDNPTTLTFGPDEHTLYVLSTTKEGQTGQLSLFTRPPLGPSTG